MLVEEENEQQVETEPEELEEVESENDEIEEDDGEEEVSETEEVEDAEEDETVITLGEETAPQEEDEKSAPEWVKDLRKKHRELAKENQELKAKIEAREQETVKPIELKPKPKPKLSDFDYDEDEFDKAVDEWHQNKLAYEEQQRNIKKQEQAKQEEWQERLDYYNEKRDTLKVKDFEESEFVVTSTLTPTQQGMIVQGSDNPAALVYALGKHPKKAKELSSIDDPVKFAFAVAKLETTMKVSSRKSPPPPEKKVSGTGNLSGTVDSTLERLRKEAEKTGDYTKVTAYKRNKNKK